VLKAPPIIRAPPATVTRLWPRSNRDSWPPPARRGGL